MDFKIQRFKPGHPFYTQATLSHEGKEYGAVFGQCVDSKGKFMHYTLERKDTLIPEDTYIYDLYFSPHNKCTVPRLLYGTIHTENIAARELEHHIANFPYELNGCCAHGKSINLAQVMLVGSGIAFHELMVLVGTTGGKITYETLQ